ncbi:hypothetical protein [Bradyrhizobium sp. USDA 3650]
MREAARDHSEADEAQFVPVAGTVVPVRTAHRERRADSGIIEIEVDGITIGAGPGSEIDHSSVGAFMEGGTKAALTLWR